MKHLPTLCFLIFAILSCRNTGNVSEKVIKKFNSQKYELDNLIKDFQNPVIDSILTSDHKVTFKAKEFPLAISKQMISLDLLDVSVHYGGRPNKKVFILKTDWNYNDSIFIVHNISDLIETKKGYYRKDENSNEIWGLGG